jgi:hypothetical protein
MSETVRLSHTSQNIRESLGSKLSTLPEIVKPMTAEKSRIDEEREAVIKI